MARLGSKAKAGFYPTPPAVTKLIKQRIAPQDGEVRYLDPCCGEGKTISEIAEGFSSVVTLGIELDHERLSLARPNLDRALWGDALIEVKITPGSIGLLYLNPPYDFETVGNGDRSDRLEARFLRRFTGVLQNDGWLVFVVPYNILDWCAKVLSRSFVNVQVFAFPEGEFEVFKQCVVVGQKRTGLADKKTAEKVEAELNNLAALSPDSFLCMADSVESLPTMEVPAATMPLKTFYSMRVDPEEAIPLARKDGMLHSILTTVTPRRIDSLRPLAPLENGHLTLLMAGGKLNGLAEKDGQRLVIKGVVKKTEEVVDHIETEKGYKITTKGKYLPTVKAIDLNSAEMLLIQ